MNYRFRINNNFYLIFILVGLPISVLLKDYNLLILPDFNLELVKIYRLLLVLFTIYLLIKLKNTLNYPVLLLLMINLVFIYNQILGAELIFKENLSAFLEKNTDLKNIESEKINLTRSEFLLLRSLMEEQGCVLTREDLISKIQGVEVNVTGRTVDTHVFGLRKKLKQYSACIETIRGVGYRINPPA